MIKFSLPGYYRHKDLILFFLQLQQQTPEIFLPDRVIDSAYDFPCLTWNGGREYTVDRPLVERDLIKMQGELEALRCMGLKLRHTCTNSLIQGRYVKDKLCNFYLGNMEKEGDSVIVANPYLKQYIMDYYPKYSIINSTTLCLNNLEDFNNLSEKELTVLSYNYNNDNDFLSKLTHPENIEILCAEGCRPNCPQRKDHYLSVSRANLYHDEPRFYCSYAGIHNFYLNLQTYPHMVTNERVNEMYAMGIENFKIAGRSIEGHCVLEIFLYYLIKPEYHNITRCEAIAGGVCR